MDYLVEVGTAITDSRNGKVIHLFRCDCGERVWQD
jgi:hypothetical protein